MPRPASLAGTCAQQVCVRVCVCACVYVCVCVCFAWISHSTPAIHSDTDCDIRIQLPYVSQRHTRVSVDDKGRVWVENLSDTNTTSVNDVNITQRTLLKNGDVFTISDRSFRWEYADPAISLVSATLVLHPNA